MTVAELIAELNDLDPYAEVQVWDAENLEASSTVLITETSNGKILIW